MGVNKILEKRIVSLLRELRAEGGALFVLGYDADKHSSGVCPLKGVDYFDGLEINVHNSEFKDALYDCMTGESHDGAILVAENGRIIQNDTGLLFHPDIYLKARGRKGDNLSKQFGLAEMVGARHIAAKCFSYEMGVRVVTLSQETGAIRVFDNGYTVYSDISSEVEKIPAFKNRHHPVRKMRVG